jgi:serine/threonine protein kinase
MNADDMKRAHKLRRSDPRQVGGYTLLGRLGAGGMGVVYLAKDGGGRLVAVKVVHADLAGDDEFRGRFRSEVNQARQVPSFCTAEVLDADADHDPPYLVVEYVDGPSLGEVVEERGPLTPGNVHAVAVGVASALSAIHGAGVIHRDLKPRNVLLAPGSPKVIDFGIARAFESNSQLTRTGQLVGTVAYMAPERFAADPGAALTPAADIFAWGSVVAYAATGRNPFEGKSPPETATRILSGVPNLNGLTGPLYPLVEFAFARDPRDRPTARELLDLLLTTGSSSSPVLTGAVAARPRAHSVHAESRLGSGSHARPDARREARPGPRSSEPRSAVTGRARTDGLPPVSEPDTPAFSHQRRGPGRRQASYEALSRQGRRPPAHLLPVTPPGRDRRTDDSPAGGAGRFRRRASGGSIAVQVAALLLLVTALVVGTIATVVNRPAKSQASTASTLSAPGRPESSVVRSDLSNKCVDIRGGGDTAGSRIVQMWPCSAAPSQVWRWAPDGTLQSQGRCLDLRDGSTQDGTTVQLATCDGSSGQQWIFTPGRDVVNPRSDKCLDIRNTNPADRARLQVWACRGTPNQKWTLTR